jgi:DNA gyrase subunit A
MADLMKILTRKDIGEVVESSMVDYAEQTILDRAIPDVRDGMKPVQRRILFGMGELNLWNAGKTLKCARIVGEVLGKYHPHGDQSVYGALTRLAQDFAMRLPLVKGQGNFGSIDGDGPAAMRYTEAKLSLAGELMLSDIDKDTVDFTENFDGTLKEPSVLPARIPNLLINGSTGIAVGMSTDILPHNLNEVCSAVMYVTQRWATRDGITVDDLMQIVRGPDLPTGGLLYRYRRDEKEGTVTDMIRTAYETGYSPLVCQAKADIEKNGKTQIIISEIPFQVSKTTILERVARQKDRLVGKISDVVDESDQDGLRIVFEVSRGCDPQEALEALLNYTNLRMTLSCNHLVLNIDDDGNIFPEIMSLRDMLVAFVKHRLNVIVRRSEFEKKKAQARVHIVNGLLSALAKIEEVIAIIKKSKDVDSAKENLIKLLAIDEIQAQAILDMQLRRLASLEVRKLQDEKKELDAKIKALVELLGSEAKRLTLIADEMREINDKNPTPRRTVIVENEGGHKETVTVADLLVPKKPQLVMVTNTGLTRVDADGYRDNVTSGKPSSRAVETILGKVVVEPEDNVMLLSSRGRLWLGNVGRLPDKGGFSDLGLEKNETLVGIDCVDPAQTVVFVTRCGSVKRTRMADVLAARSEGAWGTAIGLEGSGDEVLCAVPASDQAQVMIFSRGSAAKGLDPRALRFEAGSVNPQATPSARGVAAIKIVEGDPLLGAVVIEPGEMSDGFVVVVTEKGFAKKVKLAEYPVQGRAGQGVQAMKLHPAAGAISVCTVARGMDQIDLISEKGKRLRIPVRDIPAGARAAKGENITAKYDGLFGDEPIVAIAVAPGGRASAADSSAKPDKGTPPGEKKPAAPAKPAGSKTAPAKPAGKPTAEPQPKPAASAKKAAPPAAVEEKPAPRTKKGGSPAQLSLIDADPPAAKPGGKPQPPAAKKAEKPASASQPSLLPKKK